jgi:hypothetical protein
MHGKESNFPDKTHKEILRKINIFEKGATGCSDVRNQFAAPGLPLAHMVK